MLSIQTFPPWEKREHERLLSRFCQSNKGHGRLETRSCEVLEGVERWLDWPGAKQIARVVRTRQTAKAVSTETAWYVTSLPRQQADARRMLALTRGHWGIENSLHYVRDMTFGEDACRVRTGAAPQAMAAVRNAAIFLLRRVKRESIAQAIRFFAGFPQAVIALCRGEQVTLNF